MTTTLHHQKSTRAQRRWIPMASVGIVVLVAAIVAVMLAGGSSLLNETGSVSISGASLPAMSTPDTAIGMRAPVVRGTSFLKTGSVDVPTVGKPTVIVFLAHWCPHCRKDVPVIQSWLNANGLPAGVDLSAVSTWVDESKPNYPPSTWLHDAGWSSPVLADDVAGHAAAAYGLTGTPLWVFVSGDGLVKFRLEGEVNGPQLGAAIHRLLGA